MGFPDAEKERLHEFLDKSAEAIMAEYGSGRAANACQTLRVELQARVLGQLVVLEIQAIQKSVGKITCRWIDRGITELNDREKLSLGLEMKPSELDGWIDKEKLWYILDREAHRVISQYGSQAATIACLKLSDEFGIQKLGQLLILDVEDLEKTLGAKVTSSIQTALDRLNKTEGQNFKLGMFPHQLHGWFKAREIQPETELIED